MEIKRFVLVSIFSLKINEPYYYYILDETYDNLTGFRCVVEINNNYYCGIILSQTENPQNIERKKIKPVLKIIDTVPYLNNELISMALWMAKYYFTPLGKILSSLCPGGTNIKVKTIYKPVKKNIILDNKTFYSDKDSYSLNELISFLKTSKQKISGLIKKGYLSKDFDIISEKKYYNKNYFSIKITLDDNTKLTKKEKEVAYELRDKSDFIYHKEEFYNFYSKYIITKLKKKNIIEIIYSEPNIIKTEKTNNIDNHILTDEQQKIFDEIRESIINNLFNTYLIFGVTGSGKTEIYIRLIKEVLKKNKTVIMIVPEIGLTPQTLYNFSKNFDEDSIAVVHSRLNDKERYNAWEKIKQKKIRIVIGVRSAIFAPLENIGLIVVDEEHEDTYKNNEMPTYNARDIAVLRSKTNNAVALLGSATPSVESYYNALSGKYNLLRLKKRVFHQRLPEIGIIDFNKTTFMEKQTFLSYTLLNEMKKVLKSGKQVMLFLNRRGYANVIVCQDCGTTFSCINCEIGLTYHKANHNLICHYCGFTLQEPFVCQSCGSKKTLKIGTGTEKICEILSKKFYNKKIFRVDLDTMRFKDSYETFFNKINNKEVDIIVGTQIITKGHNFPNIGLVGIICADLSLNFPDYRSSEKTFSLLMQVSGRTGRGEEDSGKVIIQTFNPEHYSIDAVLNYDYNKYYETELNIRESYFYPPYKKILLIELKGINKSRVLYEAMNLKNNVKSLGLGSRINLLGPAPGVISKIKNLFIYRLMIKTDDIKYLHFIYEKFIKNKSFYSQLRLEI